MEGVLRRALRRELLEVITSAGELRLLAQDAGLKASDLPAEGSIEERLAAVLELMERRQDGTLQAFLRLARDEYPRRTWPALTQVLGG